MLCKDCGTENAEQVRFCVGCGRQLSRQPVPAAAKGFPWRPLLAAASLAAIVFAAYLIVALLVS